MPATSSTRLWRRALGLTSGLALLAAQALPASAQSAVPAPAAAGCGLGQGIQHVIFIEFDNVHLRRDRPDVPSDLEQMPHLLNFVEQNGTLLGNDHTILIAHTAGES